MIRDAGTTSIQLRDLVDMSAEAVRRSSNSSSTRPAPKPNGQKVHDDATRLVQRDWATWLRVTVLKVPRPPGGQRFECNAYPAPYVRPEALLYLAFVAELERAQLVVGKP
jgi:hypothetical protein